MSTLLREPKKSAYFPNPDLPIGLWIIENQEPREDHEHDFFEIAIITTGSGEHEFSGTVLPVHAGDVFVIKAGERHAWRQTQHLGVLNLMIESLEKIPELVKLRAHPAFDALFFHEPNLRDRQRGRGRLRLDSSELADATHLVKRLDEALHRKEPPHPFMAKIILLDLVSLLCEAYMAAPREEQQAVLRVGEAVRRLEADWVSPPDHEELAGIINVSVATFYRLFKQATGTTPADYLNRLRVKEACRLIRDTDKPITAIAYDVGFMDSNYFSTLFRKIQGVTPRAFRNTRRAG